MRKNEQYIVKFNENTPEYIFLLFIKRYNSTKNNLFTIPVERIEKLKEVRMLYNKIGNNLKIIFLQNYIIDATGFVGYLDILGTQKLSDVSNKKKLKYENLYQKLESMQDSGIDINYGIKVLEDIHETYIINPNRNLSQIKTFLDIINSKSDKEDIISLDRIVDYTIDFKFEYYPFRKIIKYRDIEIDDSKQYLSIMSKITLEGYDFYWVCSDLDMKSFI